MTTDKRAFDELQDKFRGRFLCYLRRAFQQIPPLPRPRILDIGCGSGLPTLELARLSGGDVTGIDIDVYALQRLEEKVKAADLTDTVHIVEGSLKNMDFPKASFDILWAEGSANVIGFEQALKDWKRFLKPNGYFVVHDEVGDLEQKKRQVAAQGYKLIDSFVLDSDIWWTNYFEPLRRAVQKIRRQNPSDLQLLAALEQVDMEIQAYRDHPEDLRSAYLIMALDSESS